MDKAHLLHARMNTETRTPLYVNIERIIAFAPRPLLGQLAKAVRERQHFTLGQWLLEQNEVRLQEVVELCATAQQDDATLRHALLLVLMLAMAEGLEVGDVEQALHMLESLLAAASCALMAIRGELVLDWARLTLESDERLPVRFTDETYQSLVRRARS